MRAFCWLFLFSIFVSLAGRAGGSGTEEAREEFLVSFPRKLLIAYEMAGMKISALPASASGRAEALAKLEQVRVLLEEMINYVKEFTTRRNDFALASSTRLIQEVINVCDSNQLGGDYLSDIRSLAQGTQIPEIERIVNEENRFAPNAPYLKRDERQPVDIYLVVSETIKYNRYYAKLVARFFASRGYNVLYSTFDRNLPERLHGMHNDVYVPFVIILDTDDGVNNIEFTRAMGHMDVRQTQDNKNHKNTIFTLQLSSDETPKFLFGEVFPFDNIYQREQVLNNLLPKITKRTWPAPAPQHVSIAGARSIPSVKKEEVKPSEREMNKAPKLQPVQPSSIKPATQSIPAKPIPQVPAVKAYPVQAPRPTTFQLMADKLPDPIAATTNEQELIELRLWSVALEDLWNQWSKYEQNKLMIKDFRAAFTNNSTRLWAALQSEDLVHAHAIASEMKADLLPRIVNSQGENVSLSIVKAYLRACLATPAKYKPTILDTRYKIHEGLRLLALEMAKVQGLSRPHIALVHQADASTWLRVSWLQKDLEQIGCKVTVFDGNVDVDSEKLFKDRTFTHAIIFNSIMKQEFRAYIGEFLKQLERDSISSFDNASSVEAAFSIYNRGKNYDLLNDYSQILRVTLEALFPETQFSKIFQKAWTQAKIPKGNAWSFDDIAMMIPLYQPPVVAKQEEMLVQVNPAAQLVSEDNGGEDMLICKICFEKNKDTLFLPCRHLGTCFDCAKQVKKCPFCIVKIEQCLSVIPQ